MMRYFFDSDDGSRAIRDDVGVTLASLEEVKATMRDFLLDLGHADELSEQPRLFTVAVRDESGATIIGGTMALAASSDGRLDG